MLMALIHGLAREVLFKCYWENHPDVLKLPAPSVLFIESRLKVH